MRFGQHRWVSVVVLGLWGAGVALGGEPRRATEPPIPTDLHLRPIDLGLIWRAIRPALAEGRRPELVEELVALFTDPNPLQPTSGWYHDGRSRFGWKGLADRFDADRDGAISPQELGASKRPWAWKSLDRDEDRRVTAEDLDWSRTSSWVRGDRPALRRFRQIDLDSNGRISPEEWAKSFEAVSQGKDYISIEDLRKRLTLPPEPTFQFSFRYRWNRARVTLTGDLGSLFEGPALGAEAPDFSLTTQDGSRRISLSEFRGRKPVVLILGSFTCPHYRSQFGILEDMHKRYGDRVEFVGVYVREAHPTDGWRTRGNDDVGITFAQPIAKDERIALATVCKTRLELTIPLLVDEIDDRVGNAYSGMPDRLYLIDRDGKVAYKGGRGPFGYYPAELEQSLVMLLLDGARETAGDSPAAAKRLSARK